MKDERNVRRRRAAGRKWQPVAILLAAVLMVLSVPLGLKSAFAAEYEFIDLGKKCSLTFSLTNTEDQAEAKDVESAKVVIDLYHIANAEKVEGYDTYTLKANIGFEDLEADITNKDIDVAGWKDVAQKAAGIVLGSATGDAAEWDPSASVEKIDGSLKIPGNPANTKIEGLDPGLYLVIAHGSDVTEYATTVTDETGSPGIATIANSETYAYKFSPELISLPTKDPYPDEKGTINTANPRKWIYEAAATLKYQREIRVGDLQITKDLEDYRKRATDDKVVEDPATFVFEVTAYKDKTDAEVVYHDMVSIVFDVYGSKSVLVKDLPVGSYVKVSEVYHGNYSKEQDKFAIVKARDEELASVTFQNTYNDGEPGGGSVTNRFEYSMESDTWGWKQVEDNTDESVQNPIQMRDGIQ